jgi:hypothetical protein
VTSGRVLAGSQSVTLITSSDFVGTILGDISRADAVYSYSVGGTDTLKTIPFTITAGSIEILTIN